MKQVEIARDLVVLGSIDGNLQTARLGAKPAALCQLHSIQAHERLIIVLKTVIIHGRACIVSLGWDKFTKWWKSMKTAL